MGQVGLLQLLGMSLPPCSRYHPAGVRQTYQPVSVSSYCLRLKVAGSASRTSDFRGHLCVYFRLRPGNLLITPSVTLRVGFRNLVSLLSAIQATGLLAFTLTGLPPAEHTCLIWTHGLHSGMSCPSFKIFLAAFISLS